MAQWEFARTRGQMLGRKPTWRLPARSGVARRVVGRVAAGVAWGVGEPRSRPACVSVLDRAATPTIFRGPSALVDPLGDRLTAGRKILALAIKVRILVPQLVDRHHPAR